MGRPRGQPDRRQYHGHLITQFPDCDPGETETGSVSPNMRGPFQIKEFNMTPTIATKRIDLHSNKKCAFANIVTNSGFRFHVRAAHPKDEAELSDFFKHVTPEDLRFRFLSGLRK